MIHGCMPNMKNILTHKKFFIQFFEGMTSVIRKIHSNSSVTMPAVRMEEYELSCSVRGYHVHQTTVYEMRL